MKVDDVMTRNPVSCQSTENLGRAAQLMWDHDCGCIPVVDDEQRVIGMVTDRDVCMAAFHAGRPLHELIVAEAMAEEPYSVRPDDPIAEAEKAMCRARVRRLPVTDVAGRLVGVLSLHDLVRTATRERRWFSGVTLREVAKVFAEISRPWEKPAPPEMRTDERYAE